MSFSRNDFLILMATSITIVGMSFVFPALGLAGKNVNSTQIPDFNTSKGKFDWQKEQPSKPGGPSKGILNHSSDQFDSYEGSIQYELGKNSDGNRTVLIVNPENETKLNDIAKITDNTLDNHTFTSNDEEKTISGGGFTVDLISRDIDRGIYEFIVKERPSDQNWAKGIPVIGDVISGADQTAAFLGWIGSMGFYFIERFSVGVTNAFIVVFNIITFFISLVHWQLNTYYNIVNNTPTEWAKVFTLLPGIVFSIEFGRISLIFLKKIPGVG